VTDWNSAGGIQVMALAAAPLILGTAGLLGASTAATRASRMQPAAALRSD